LEHAVLNAMSAVDLSTKFLAVEGGFATDASERAQLVILLMRNVLIVCAIVAAPNVVVELRNRVG